MVLPEFLIQGEGMDHGQDRPAASTGQVFGLPASFRRQAGGEEKGPTGASISSPSGNITSDSL